MREIVFRRCRLEIEPTGLVRVIHFAPDQFGRHLDATPGEIKLIAPTREQPNEMVDVVIAHAFLTDVLDEPGVDDETISFLLLGVPIAAFGQWDTMAQIWFDRLRRGWQLVGHGEPLIAATVTSFLASAIEEDANVDRASVPAG